MQGRDFFMAWRIVRKHHRQTAEQAKSLDRPRQTGRQNSPNGIFADHKGHSVCWCGLEEGRTRRPVEIPAWMFEPAACGRLRVMAVPSVGCDALLELKALLRSAPPPDSSGVLQAQHHSLLTAGGADATVREPTTTLATHALSSLTPASVASDVARRDSR